MDRILFRRGNLPPPKPAQPVERESMGFWVRFGCVITNGTFMYWDNMHRMVWAVKMTDRSARVLNTNHLIDAEDQEVSVYVRSMRHVKGSTELGQITLNEDKASWDQYRVET